VPLEVEIFEAAKRWHKTPWEIKQMPVTEFNKMIQMELLEADNG
jgi:hypothetical protein